MFKNGDYIVYLTQYSKEFDNVSMGFKENYCFKINSSHNTQHVFFPATGGAGWFIDTIRLATPEEIAEYERIGEPYDVTTIVSVKETDYNYLIPILKRFKII